MEYRSAVHRRLRLSAAAAVLRARWCNMSALSGASWQGCAHGVGRKGTSHRVSFSGNFSHRGEGVSGGPDMLGALYQSLIEDLQAEVSKVKRALAKLDIEALRSLSSEHPEEGRATSQLGP